jgi:hypothetical protein
LLLDGADGLSSLAASLSMVAKLHEGCIDATAANEVHCGTRSVLVSTLSPFLELEIKLEMLGSGHDVGLMEDRVRAL